MQPRAHKHNTILSAHRRLLSGHDDDPLASVANLFDVAMVFAVALLMALVSHFHLAETFTGHEEITILKNPGQSNMEIIHRKGEKLEHYSMSTQTLGGEGEKLGTAYRLKNGEVIYVPEE